jgi:hypothetical protein
MSTSSQASIDQLATFAHEMGHASRLVSGALYIEEVSRDRSGSAEAFGFAVARSESQVMALQVLAQRWLEAQFERQMQRIGLDIVRAFTAF